MHGLDRPRRRLATALAALAGYVDATGYLSADRYFVSFMSGNTTRLATDLLLGRAAAVLPALLIAGFVLGVALGSAAGHLAGPWRKPAVLLLVTAMLTIAAAGSGHPAWLLGCLVLAMGALNNALQRDDGPVALTYLTGALVRIGQALGARATRRATDPLLPFVALWLALAGGAAAGAAAFLALGPACLWVAVAASALLSLAGWRLSRS